MLLGGAVQGGRVLADWPGLATGALYQGRDLQPTMGLDALISATLGECFGIEPERVGRALFPRVVAGKALPTLLRA
jgi:uncharacterized protein (DUF1501 family)